MQRFTELKVWERSHALTLKIYSVTSVPCNIAEGSKRRTNKDYSHFLNMAVASLTEVEYILMLARDLGYLAQADTEPLLSETDSIARMLHALRVKVEPARK